MHRILLACLLVCCLIGSTCGFFITLPAKPKTATIKTSDLLWPMPSKFSMNETQELTKVDPCAINYKITAVPEDYVRQMLNVYLIDVFQCKQTVKNKITLTIVVKNPNEMVAYTTDREKYQLTLRITDKWELVADYYPGFLRGLETFSQLFEKSLDADKNTIYQVRGLPIIIDDKPDYQWRGLMIDSSRHFLPLEAVKKTIDGMMYSKMNVLHWHITDEDSFPMELKSRPEITASGRVGGTYTQSEVKSIINYAKTRGVRVVPEFDTPAHTQSWGRSEKLSSMILNCNSEYEGQFDPTLNLTYQVVKDVFTEVNSLFEDEYVHFGGDEIVMSCFDQRPAIKDWMAKNNIANYTELQIYYRQQQKKIWRNISSHKKAIYWANEKINLPVEKDDVIHWWGITKNVDALKNRTNDVVLSNYDLTYLDVGYGNRYGNQYGVYIRWRQLYTFNPKIDGVNVVGAETCMWSELSNADTHEQKVWMRTNVLNERLWTSSISLDANLPNIAKRLIAQTARLSERGFKMEPVTVGLCEKDPSICFH